MTAIRAYSTNTSLPQIVMALPSGSRSGDLAVLVVGGPTAVAYAGPVGGDGVSWTSHYEADVGTAQLSRIGVWSKVLNDLDLLAGAITVSRTGSGTPWVASLASIPGFTGVNAVGTPGAWPSATVAPYGSVTPSASASLLLAAGAVRSSSGSVIPAHTPPAGWTSVVESDNVLGSGTQRGAWLDQLQLSSAAGVASPSASASVVTSSGGGAVLLALTPALVAAGLHPSNELVAVAWLKGIPYLGSRVATELPTDNTSWSASGFVTVQAAGGSADAYLQVSEPVISVDCWATPVNGSRPPWNMASQLAEEVKRAAWAHQGIPRKVTMPSGYYGATVLQVQALTEPQRIRDDVASYAHYTQDLLIRWIEVPA